MLTNESIQETLSSKFGEDVKNFTTDFDMLTFEVSRNKNTELLQHLRDELGFNFLTDVCGLHLPDNDIESQFSVVYHVHNWVENVRIRIKVFLNGENPEIETVSNLYLSANWQERETYDFYGIVFTGHPDLKRILNMDEMVSFPMRKEFPLEDANRTDKDDRYFGRIPVNTNLN
jgi:NADH-quinone oxidoreductase subunit C